MLRLLRMLLGSCPRCGHAMRKIHPSMLRDLFGIGWVYDTARECTKCSWTHIRARMETNK